MTGVFAYIKLILRRDRVSLPVWIFAIVGTMVSLPLTMHATVGSPRDLAAIAAQLSGGSSVLNFVTGPFELTNGSPALGGITLVKTQVFAAVLIAFFAGMFVLRHTRKNEEIGAAELILSEKVSRFAPLSATLIVAFSAISLMTILSALGIFATINGVDGGWGAGAPSVWNGAWLFSLSIGGVGVAFAAIAAVVAQLTETTSSANGLWGGLVGVAFFLRGIGDVAGIDSAWSYFSPFGWAKMTHSLTSARWWPLGIFAIFAIGVSAISYLLLTKRDLCAGILPAKKGRARARFALKIPLGLTLKLQKNIFFGWAVTTLAFAVIIGSMAEQLNKIYASSAAMKSMMGALSGTDPSALAVKSTLFAMIVYLAFMAVAFALQSLGKLRSEESSGRLENLLATKISRISWVLGHVACAFFGGAILLFLTGFLIAATANFSGVKPALDALDYGISALAILPLIVAAVGIYVALFGIFPRISGAISWELFGVMVAISMFGAIFAAAWRAFAFLKDFSPTLPFAHIATGNATRGDWLAFWLTIAFSLALFAAGMVFWRRRNLANDN